MTIEIGRQRERTESVQHFAE
jgi:hypothetical protein